MSQRVVNPGSYCSHILPSDVQAYPCLGGTSPCAQPGPESSQHPAEQDKGKRSLLIYSAFVSS